MVNIKVVQKDGEVKEYQYASLDLAIVALGKMVGAPVKAPPAATQATPPAAPAAPTSTRKSRADKGQTRAPYAPRTNATAGQSTLPVVGTSPDHAVSTDPSKTGQQAVTSTSTTTDPAVAPVASAPVAPVANKPVEGGTVTVGTAGLDTAVPEKQAEPGSAGQQAATPTSTPSGTASATVEEAQKALEKMYEVVGHEPSKSALARFGVKRFVELLPEHRGPFIALATKLASITKDKPGTPAFDALVQAVLAS